jgi:GNAT superfamily N-acetyltransferase
MDQPPDRPLNAGGGVVGSPNPRVIVREAEDCDLPRLLDLYDQLAEGRDSSRPADARHGVAILDAVRSVPGRALLVAVVADRVVGTADCLIVVNLTHAGRPWAIVENVVVDADARRDGVGSALMRDVLERAHRAGCYKVQLMSRADRPGAHAFYRSLLFEPGAVGFRRYLDASSP